MKKSFLRVILSLALCMLIVTVFSATAFAAGDVSSAIEGTWNAAKSQVQTVVNNVVFPVIDMILAILFFVKVGTSYFEYRKHGQFEFAAPCILFACLIFTLNVKYGLALCIHITHILTIEILHVLYHLLTIKE